jgi:hypothetical protein
MLATIIEVIRSFAPPPLFEVFPERDCKKARLSERLGRNEKLRLGRESRPNIQDK